MSRKRIIPLTVVVIILCVYLFLLVFPLVLVGSPTSLYYIHNNDDKTHSLSGEIFDENNVSVFQKNHTLQPDETTDYDREVNWHLPFPSTFISWSDGLYTFSFTVDNNVSKSITRDTNQYETIFVDLYSNYASKIIPIRIGIVTV